MINAYFVFSLLSVLLVVNIRRPIRKEPLSVFSFVAGGFIGEVPFRAIVVGMGVSVFVGFEGVFSSDLGLAGLALAAASWLGFLGIAITIVRTSGVVERALAEATGGPIPVDTDAAHPRWATPWRLTLGLPMKGHGIKAVRNVDYVGDGHRRHRLDVYTPRQNPEKAPVLLYIHGGAWMIGEKRQQGKPMMYELASRGWVCVTINYRLSPKATWPDHIVDVKRAVSWVRQHIAEYGGDPSFLAISGGSAGGHLAALAALSAGDPTYQPGFETEDTSVDACVPFYGVMDMTGAKSGSGKYGPGLRELLEKKVMKVSASDRPEVFAKASPTFRVHATAPPFFVLHGMNDTLVPIEVAREFIRSLTAVSTAPVAYAELPLAQHAFDLLPSLRTRATTAGVVAFLDNVREHRHAAKTLAD